jgi:glucose/galactose transporter
MSPTSHQPGLARSIAIVGGLFFILGFFTWMNGPLLTYVRLAFDLDEVNSFLILMVFYLSYFLLALPAAWIHGRVGLKKGLSLSLGVIAVGAAVFGEFATRRWYSGALGGLFVIGGGLALLQTAVNPYVSIIGPIESAAQRIALMGICNKTAGVFAPLVVGAFVLRGAGDLAAQLKGLAPGARGARLDAFAARIEVPYLIMAGVLLAVALAVLRSPLPDLKGAQANTPPPGQGSESGGRTIFGFPHLWLGVLCLFLYVGAEVMAGDAIGAYGRAFDLPLDQTKFFTAFTLGAMLAGYVAGLVATPRFITQQAYLGFSAMLGLAFVACAFFSRGYVSVGFVAALGFANAMMWPAIFPLAIRGLGRFTELGSALLVMGVVGGAVTPQLFAVLKQHYDFQVVFAALMGPSYLYILCYAWRGHSAGALAGPRIVTAPSLNEAGGP